MKTELLRVELLPGGRDACATTAVLYGQTLTQQHAAFFDCGGPQRRGTLVAPVGRSHRGRSHRDTDARRTDHENVTAFDHTLQITNTWIADSTTSWDGTTAIVPIRRCGRCCTP